MEGGGLTVGIVVEPSARGRLAEDAAVGDVGTVDVAAGTLYGVNFESFVEPSGGFR